MKTKRFIALMISLIMVLSMMSIAAFAVTPTDAVSEVELTLPEPRAGETVNLSFAAVEAKHHMTYKVVGLRWYKEAMTDEWVLSPVPTLISSVVSPIP